MSTRSPNEYEVPNMDDFLGGPNREQRSAEMHASLMSFLTESDSMRKTAKNSLRQSLYAGGGAFAGSFIGGPVGGLVGGIAGSLVGFFKSDDYDGLLLAVSKIDDAHRTKLLKVSGYTGGAKYEETLENDSGETMLVLNMHVYFVSWYLILSLIKNTFVFDYCS